MRLRRAPALAAPRASRLSVGAWALVLALVLARSAPGEAIEPVQQAVPDGFVDWSLLRLELTVASQHTRGAWQDRRLQEQDAMDRLRNNIIALAGEVCVVPGTSARDLIARGGALGDRLGDGLSRWEVEEARYFNQGGVELVGTLDLRAWLWPAMADMASPETLPPPEGAPITGLVVDARGLSFPLCLGPILRNSLDGPVLSDIHDFSAELARRQAPALYVRDPADPRAAARAGETPLLVRAVAVAPDGGLVIESQAAARLAAEPSFATLINRGQLVIVVEP